MKTKTKSSSDDAQIASSATTVRIGFDLGTNTSCLKIEAVNNPGEIRDIKLRTVVGYTREGILEDILPENATMLFGEEALRHRMHLDMQRPLSFGVIRDPQIARDFCLHLKTLLNLSDEDETRVVIGVPAKADADSREKVRLAVKGIFDKAILIPEPFLAALGFRDESKLREASYIDPVKNSLFVDIGAGSTDLCLVQGYYPRPEDQTSLPFAGDKIDEILAARIGQKYPDSSLTSNQIKQFKEQYSYVGEADETIQVKTIHRGKPLALEIGSEVRAACESLFENVFNSVCHLISMSDPESVPELLQNIIITGGGSQIKGFAEKLQNRLIADGYEGPKVSALGENYKDYVASGALKASRSAREHQWQTLL